MFRARQRNLDRIVALKMILAGQFATQKDVDRFYAEAEAAAQLDHPGIVPIHEIGQHDGRHYFSMAYVDGENLASKVANGPLPPIEAAQLMLGICDAISYAHDHGVIHRDLKPANVLIDSSGNTRVTDFGLAKRVEAVRDLTQTGQVLGTPAYMPPEQAAGRVSEIGRLSDVYSLGAILYSLLTGRPPFQSASALDTLQQVLHYDVIAARSLNPSIPLDLETITSKCLNKDPLQRYQSVGKLSDDISRFLSHEPIRARRISIPARLFKWYMRNVEFVAPVAMFATALMDTLIGIGSQIATAVRAAIIADRHGPSTVSVSYNEVTMSIVYYLLILSVSAFLCRAAWRGRLYGVLLNSVLAILFPVSAAFFLCKASMGFC